MPLVYIKEKDATVKFPDGTAPDVMEQAIRDTFFSPEETAQMPTFKEREGYRLRKGQSTVNVGMAYWNAMSGYTTDDTARRFEEGINKEFTPENDVKFGASNLGEKFVGATTELTPYMFSSAVSGVDYGNKFGAAAAAAAIAAGQAGPQVALPEEVITVPVAYVLGRSIGQAYGALQNAMRVEGGNIYGTLLREGVDRDTARKWAVPAGTLIGAVELLQIGHLFNRFPGASKLGKKPITDLVVKAAKKGAAGPLRKFLGLAGKIGKKTAVTTAFEIAEEDVQELITLTAEAGAHMQKAIEEDTDSMGPTFEEARNRIKETTVQGLLGFPLLGLPGSVVSVAGGRSSNKATTKKGQDALKDQLKPLVDEARKFDNVDEFIKDNEVEITDETVQDLGFDNKELMMEATFEEGQRIEAEGPPVEEIAPEARVIDVTEEGEPTFEFGENIKEAIKVPEGQKKSALEIQLEAIQDKEVQAKVAKEALEQGNLVADFLTGKVKRFEKGYLAEELRAFPKRFFTTRKEAMTVDEALDAVNARDFGVKFANIKELAEYLTNWQKQKASLKEIITAAKPEMVRKRKATELKQRLKDIARGAREGKVVSKREIASVQKQLVNIVQEAGLPAKDRAKFLATIKNIQTRKQLEGALPGIEERIAMLAERAEKDVIVREIERAAAVKVDPDYREQIDAILEEYNLKRKTPVPERRRESKKAFLERQREEGNLDFIPQDFFIDFKKTLGEMTLEEVEQLRDQVQVLATVGATKNRLIAVRGEIDFQKRLSSIVGRAYEKAGTKEVVEGAPGPVVGNQQKGFFERTRDIIDNFFASHRKVEFILRSLDNSEVFEMAQDGINKELTLTEEAYTKLKDAFMLISRNFKTMTRKLVKIEGVPVELTREQMIGVALNNGNLGNRERLVNGNKFTDAHIKAIEAALTPNEKKFVERIFEIIDEQFPGTVEVSKKLIGIKPKKVVGKYFPIYTDKELNKRAKFNEAQRDLFQDIFHVTFVERGFTYERVGGRDPLDLNVFPLIFRHMDGVIHFNSMGIPVRNVQKIINHPRFEKAVSSIMGEAIYDQFPSWLRDVANPKSLQASNSMDKIFQFLRHNATSSILGFRMTVSLLQGGSFTQTINEIGLSDSINGIGQFYKNPRRAIEFVYSQSPIMKNRAQRFDREIKDWLKSGQAQRMTQGRKSWGEILFSMIRGVDFITTMPSWIGAYEKNLAQTQNVEEAARFADGVVRRTQPAGAMENLSAIMRGSATQKLFTSFMTHFSNMHNQMVSAMDELKYSKDHSLRKPANFARAMWWIWVAPALLGGWVRSGFKVEDWRKFAQELILYPFSGMFLIRDVMGAIVKGFDFGAPPGLSTFKEISLAFKGKKGKTKLKHGTKAVGLLTGKVPTQWVDTVDGFIDLSNEETQDYRRLIWGESAIEPVSKGIFAPRKPKRETIGR